ncbi:MAG: hypothetical protein IJG63_08720 [Oscillospiraceae bacterium]|nr:hypothetical protein [Oscillospiraceae bacterium]
MYTVIFAAVICGAVIIALSKLLAPFPGLLSLLLLFLGIAFSCLVGMTVCICMPGKGAALICALSAAGLILSGGVIPSALLPIGLQDLGGVLPLGLSVSMALPLFGAEPEPLSVIILLLESGICITAIGLKLRGLLRRGEDGI